MKIKYVFSTIVVIIVTTGIGYLSSSDYIYKLLIKNGIIDQVFNVDKMKDVLLL